MQERTSVRSTLWALSVAGGDARFVAEIGQRKDAIAGALAAADGYEGSAC